MTIDNDIHELVGVYALGSLSDDEAESFETHLPSCGQCQQELASMEPAISALAELGPADQSVVHLTSRRSSTRKVLVAAAAAIALGLVLILNATADDRVEKIVSAADSETVLLQGDIDAVELTLSASAMGVAFDDEVFAELEGDELYVLWVFRHDSDGPEFVGNVRSDDDGEVRQSWNIPATSAEAFAVSIEDAPSPTGPSERVVLTGTLG